MSYKPQDLFIGVIDLFVIILPGSLLIFGLLRVMYGYPQQSLPWAWSGLAAATAFVFASYLLGHLISLLASKIEDFWSEKRLDLSNDPTGLRERVEAVLSDRYGLPVREKPKRVRRWAFKTVRISDGVAAVTLDRKDADRRFFRNVPLVLAIPAVVFLAQVAIVEGLVWAALCVISWRRYADQQDKFTREVYEYFVLLHPDENANESEEANA